MSCFSQTTMKHIMAVLIFVFSLGYHGKWLLKNIAPATVL